VRIYKRKKPGRNPNPRGFLTRFGGDENTLVLPPSDAHLMVRTDNTRVCFEKVSGENSVPMETWKLEHGPLDEK
jgi:hypothetical protein